MGLFALATVTFLLTFPGDPIIVRVDARCPDGGSGSSWADACNKVQVGIDQAAINGGGEVWVAAGAYEELYYDSPDATSSSAVVLRGGVDVYGGFTGVEEVRDERDWRANETIIEGMSACHVVLGADDALLDGFTIRGGVASRLKPCMNVGGGMLNIDVSPHVRNCTFTGNYGDCGGAVYNSLGSPLFESCEFFRNSATRGGAALNEGATPTYLNCRFIENRASGWTGYGACGGAVCNEPSAASFINCVFWNNLADGPICLSSRGGAICNQGDSVIDVINCTFYGNRAVNEDTYTTNYGGAIASEITSVASVLNTIFWNDYPGEVFGGDTDLSYCYIRGLNPCDPMFFDPATGDFRLEDESLCIDAGASEGAPSFDFRCVTRPQGAGVDIGACEAAPPVPAWNAECTSGLAPLEIRFFNVSECSGFPLESCEWDFGDGNFSSDVNPRHVYEWPGVYSVCLTVMTCEGRRHKWFNEAISVYAQYQAPQADFFGEPVTGESPLVVQFIDTSTASEQPILTWHWDFGDGTSSTDTNPIHTYTDTGKFTVSLTITSEGGNDTETKVDYICVERHTPMTLWDWLIWLVRLLFGR